MPTPTRQRQRRPTEPGSRDDPPWNVVVLNDDHNTFEGVAFALARVLPGVGYDQGLGFANRIHFTGRAVVWTGHKERAELYHDQLAAYGLTMAPLLQS
jgi:ATP-dependent Clp protease adaptor protein ClpS